MSPDGQRVFASAILNSPTPDNLLGLGSLHYSNDYGLTFGPLSAFLGTGTPYTLWSSVALTPDYAYAAEYAYFNGATFEGGNVYRTGYSFVVTNNSTYIDYTNWTCLVTGTNRCPTPPANTGPVSTANFISVAAAEKSGTVVACTTDSGGGGDIYVSTTNGVGLGLGKQNLQGPAGALRSWASVSTSWFGSVIAAVDSATGYVWTAASPTPTQPLPATGINWVRRDAAGARKWSTVAVSAHGNRITAAVGWPLIPINGQPATQKGFIYASADYGATWSQRTSAGELSYRSVAMRADIGF
jgi:hypothetical protein